MKFPLWIWNLRTPVMDADPQAHLLKGNDLWQHPQRKFSHNRDSFISDTSLSEDESVQDDIPVSLLVFTKGSISQCSVLFSAVPVTILTSLQKVGRCSHLLLLLWLSELILLVVFTEEMILERTAVRRHSWCLNRQGVASSEVEGGSYMYARKK